MPVPLNNLAWLKGLKLPDVPDFGTKLAELVSGIAGGVNSIEQQTNSNATGAPQPPPPINALHVNASNGHFQVGINHEGADFYRGVHYFVEHSHSPQFTDPHIVPLGTSRNANLFLGNATRYFRAYAAYPGSHAGPLVYHGGAQARAVTGGGTIPGPQFQVSQGSGTGTPGVGHSGPGPIPYRTKTGAPPNRGGPLSGASAAILTAEQARWKK